MMRSGNQTITGNIDFTNDIIGNLDGNSKTTTQLKNPRYIAGQLFDGSNDVSISITDLYDVIDKGSGKVITDDERTKINTTYPTKFNQLDSSMNEHKVQINNNNGLISNIDGNTVKITNENQTINGTKTFTNLIVGSITGNAESATQLKTGRTIAGKLFDGRNNIDINASDLADVTDAGSGKIITDAERNKYETTSSECVMKTNVNETIDGVKTFTNPIVGDLDGNAATATRLEPGVYINNVLVTGGVSIDFKSTDLTDITSGGSGKIITDAERATIGVVSSRSNVNETNIADLSSKLDIIISDSVNILETLEAVGDSTDFVLDVTQKVETVKDLHEDISSNHFALKALHETLRSDHDTLSTNHTNLKTSHEDLSSNHYNLQGLHEDLSGNHSNLQGLHNTLRSDHDDLEALHNTLSGNHISLNTSHILSTNHSNLQASHNIIATGHNALKPLHEDLSSNYYTFKESHINDFTLLSGNHDNLKNLHDTLRTEFNGVKTSHEDLSSNHYTLSSSHDSLQTRVTNVEDSNEILEDTMTAIDNKIIDISNNLYGDFTHTNSKTFTKTIIANGGITIDNKKYISGDRINYPNIVSATTYTGSDVQTNNDLASILSTLSSNIAELSTAINALHNKNVLNEGTN